MADDKTEKNKALIIEQLKKAPIVQVAVERVGIVRSTFYRWKAEDEVFKENVNQVIKEGRSLVTDLAESQLINNIKNGNMTAIIFWLKNNDGRYSERQQLSESEIKQIIKLFDNNNKQEDEFQVLARMILERKIPISFARILNFFLSSFSKRRQDEKTRERENILERIIHPKRY